MARSTHNRLSLLAIVLAVLAACGDGSRSSNAPSVPVGLDALTDLASIAELRPPGLRVEQISSYDRVGGNADLGVGPDTVALLQLLNIPELQLDHSYLYREGERYVIFDSLGPGVVQRIWMTGLDALLGTGLGGDIAFEVDDEEVPRLTLSRAELFSGAEPPFLAPLAGNDAVSSGGFYSMLPIPFAQRLRITTSVVPNWVQITWTRLPLDYEIESLDPSADVSAAAATLAAAGVDPKGITPTSEDDVPLSLAPGESAVVWERDGPGTVLRFELLAPGDVDIPVGLRLECEWDGAGVPQVDVPLDDLFGGSLGAGARSLAFGRDGGHYYLYFPMPFHESARITLRNEGTSAFSGWQLRLAAVDRVIGANPGYFSVAARSLRLEPDGRDFVLLDRAGTGHVVGVVMTAGCGEVGGCQLPQIANLDGSHLEGDERISVDGSRYPQLHGTGLEDFFNGGFYFVRGPFALPTHGNPAQVPTTSERRPGLNLRSVYRVLLGDAIPFSNHIRLAVEHGPENDVPAEMSSATFYYAVPETSLVETDRIVIGDGASEASHDLVAEGRLDRGLTSAFRGDDSNVLVTANGIEAQHTSFRVAIDPDNRGVRLGRLADIAQGRQEAVVRVNGREIGTWYSAERNPSLRWAELDFEIPASFTRGRSSLDIELDAGGSPSPWTSFGYTAASHLAPRRNP